MKTRKVQAYDWENIAKTFQIPADKLWEVCPSLAVLVCPPGIKIVREGEPGVDVFIVGKGSLTVKHSVALFFSKEVARLKPGDFFGEVGFFVAQGRTATVETLGPCEIYRILADNMQSLLEKHVDLRLRLEETARQRVQALSDSVSK
jgi:CRP-like cAMP-binding protein